jgi:hypothetical protein
MSDADGSQMGRPPGMAPKAPAHQTDAPGIPAPKTPTLGTEDSGVPATETAAHQTDAPGTPAPRTDASETPTLRTTQDAASPRRSGRGRRLVVVAALLVLAVAASASALFRSAPDARWYYAANTGVLLRLQPFPQAREVSVRSFSHAETRSDAPVFKVTWYSTRADYVVPRGTSPGAIVEFYRFQLEPLWTSRSLSQDVVHGGATVASMPGLQASQGDMFVTVLTSGMVGADGRQRPRPHYTVQVDYRVL